MENKRLTRQDERGYTYNQVGQIINKLEKLEDLLEKHNIPNIEYLERCIIAHDKYGELQEQLGCPLEVYIKATIYGVVVDGEHFYVTFNKDKDGYYFLLSNGSAWRFRTSSYKKTWWLKKDKSE